MIKDNCDWQTILTVVYLMIRINESIQVYKYTMYTFQISLHTYYLSLGEGGRTGSLFDIVVVKVYAVYLYTCILSNSVAKQIKSKYTSIQVYGVYFSDYITSYRPCPDLGHI